MAHQTRLRLLTCIKFLALTVLSVVLLVSFGIASQGEAVQPTTSGMMWEAIMGLFGVLNTILTGVIVWLVSNQREAFSRIGKLETGEEVRSSICDERHKAK